MNVRVVHEGSWAYPGGAERTAREIARALDAPVTVGHSSMPEFWDGLEVEFPFQDAFHEGLTGRFYGSRRLRSLAEFRLAQRWRELEFAEDVVITSGTTAKWWVPRHDQDHVHYCHTPPPRFYATPSGGAVDWFAKSLVGLFDRYYADFCTAMIANSAFTRDRIAKHYRRENSPVVNPPIDTESFVHNEPAGSDYFVHVGRLNEMKRAGVVARAFADLDARLVMVGDGPLAEECAAVDGVSIYSGLSDDALALLASRAVGGIAFAEKEHCGMTPKEFQAAGKPVVVPDEPNLRNHVEHGQSGVVVEPTTRGVREGVGQVLDGDWDPDSIQQFAASWSTARFREEIREVTEEIVADPEMRAVEQS